MLEVLAAVAILAIWYVVIAAMATDGLRKQGISNRLIEASEIASRVITEIETTTLEGIAPAIGDEETEEGDFLVRVLIVPFGFGVPGPNAPSPGPSSGSQSSPGLQQLLKTEMPGMATHLVSINVRVSWEEGMALRNVNRTSFAFNLAEATKVYLSEEAREAEEAAEAAEEENSEVAEDGEDEI
jgi:hypothetical protein